MDSHPNDDAPPPPPPPPHPPPPPSTDAATTRPCWKKMTASQLKAANLDEDPIFGFIMHELYPLYRDAARNDEIVGSRALWANRELYPKINAAFNIDGPSGYNTGAFKASMCGILKNALYQDKGSAPTESTKASKAKKPRATNAAGEFGKKYGDDVKAATKADFEKNGVDKPAKAVFVNAYNAKMKELSVAKGKNDLIVAGPTEEHIIKNQSVIWKGVHNALKKLQGSDWGGHGQLAFAVRGAMIKLPGKQIRRFSMSVGPDRTVAAFVSSNEAQNELDFKNWAVSVLKPTSGALPVVHMNEDGLFVVPEADGLSMANMIDLIQAYLDTMNSDFEAVPMPVGVVGAGGTTTGFIDLSVADEKEVRSFYNKLLVLQHEGEPHLIAGKAKITTGEGCGVGDDYDDFSPAGVKGAEGLPLVVNSSGSQPPSPPLNPSPPAPPVGPPSPPPPASPVAPAPPVGGSQSYPPSQPPAPPITPSPTPAPPVAPPVPEKKKRGRPPKNPTAKKASEAVNDVPKPKGKGKGKGKPPATKAGTKRKAPDTAAEKAPTRAKKPKTDPPAEGSRRSDRPGRGVNPRLQNPMGK